ncbi:MAG: hypothetical protein N3A65_09820 [candidate division WOR-3 bacterium]|nr:hypothetical protein [candidate division WOR-3 bacterium]
MRQQYKIETIGIKNSIEISGLFIKRIGTIFAYNKGRGNEAKRVYEKLLTILKI